MTGRVGRLAGKVALITGAGNGIGRQAAILFAQEGASVAVADISEEGGTETVRLVRKGGGEALFCQTDVTEEESVASAVRSAVAHYGGLTRSARVRTDDPRGTAPRRG